MHHRHSQRSWGPLERLRGNSHAHRGEWMPRSATRWSERMPDMSGWMGRMPERGVRHPFGRRSASRAPGLGLTAGTALFALGVVLGVGAALLWAPRRRAGRWAHASTEPARSSAEPAEAARGAAI